LLHNPAEQKTHNLISRNKEEKQKQILVPL